MALSTNTNKAQYSCNGSLTEFDLAVRILEEDNVSVYLKDTTDGTETTLTKTTEYTIAEISGSYDNGARITTVATYSSDYELTLVREVSYTQGLDLEEGGDMPSGDLEDALDKGVMQAQQLNEALSRTISVPATDPSGLDYSIQSVESRANKVLGFDANGNVANITLTETSSVGVDTNSGLDFTNNIISAKVDDDTIGFDGSGIMEVKDGSIGATQLTDDEVTLDKMIPLPNQYLYANLSGSTANPAYTPIVGATGILLDQDAMTDDDATKGATQQSIKAYVDTEVVAHTNILQMKASQTAANVNGSTTAITYDTAIPQITEGLVGVLSIDITPKSATSTLSISVDVSYGTSGANGCVALFVDSQADAIACSGDQNGANVLQNTSFTHVVASGDTSSRTYSVNVGSEDTTMTSLNGVSGGLKYGGVCVSSITITEFE